MQVLSKKIREPLETSSERTKRRYAAKATECLTLLLETICPGESDDLNDAMFLKCESSYTDYDAPECIKALVDSFLKAETPTSDCRFCLFLPIIIVSKI